MFLKETKFRRDILITSSAAAVSLLALLHFLNRTNPLNDPEIARTISENFTVPCTAEPLVPNYVHFILLNNGNITFTHFLCTLAALKNQHPEAIFFHTNTVPSGIYWNQLTQISEFQRVAKIIRIQVPEAILDQPVTEAVQVFYGIGILKILVLRQHGGIYLDTNTYIVKDLRRFRDAELTLDNGRGMNMGSKICLAHKDARFLKVWSELYRRLYESNSWYYFTQNPLDNILGQHQDLAQRVSEVGELQFYDRNSSMFREGAPYWKSFSVFQLPRHLQENKMSGSLSFDFHVRDGNFDDDSSPLGEMIEEVYTYARQNNSDVG